jgi:hypothetical protein
MLGDGNIPKGLYGSRLQIKRAIKDLDYLKWTAQQLHRLYNGKRELPLSKYTTKLYVDGKERFYDGYNYCSSQKTILTPLYNKWYMDGHKIVPQDLKLTDLIVAIWIADDGHNTSYAYKISTESFYSKDIDFLVFLLRDLFKTNQIIKKYKRLGKNQQEQFIIDINHEAFSLVAKRINPLLKMMHMERKI